MPSRLIPRRHTAAAYRRRYIKLSHTAKQQDGQMPVLLVCTKVLAVS